MKERQGVDLPAFLASYEKPPERGLRVNTLKLSAEEFAARAPFPLGERVPWEKNAFYLSEEKTGADPYHFAGLYYLQEPSAMAVGKLSAGCSKMRVLDLCAAPGGKTTQIAAQMKGEGILIANEINFARAKILLQNAERMGIANCAVTSASPESLTTRFPAFFDLILVDAPCSGEGMFKKEPNAVPEWSEANVAMCAARQRAILDCAAEMTAAGGHLLYSTCTFAEEEDEWQIEEFLKRHSEFSLVKAHKLYPHICRGEGHFCALLEKKEFIFCPPPASGGGEGVRHRSAVKPYPICKNSAAERAFRTFEADFFGEPLTGLVHTLGDGRMYLVPAGMPDLSGLSLLRLGVELGEFDGKIFKPAHALAMAFGDWAKRKVFLTRAESERYLRGETLTADLPNGWCTVCVEKFPLGLGKCVGGTVKNHLPKGLRKVK